jgi:hypothetical protein
MDSLAATILAVIEQAAISGLYRKEQLQIGVQEAHKRRPVLVMMRCLSWPRQYMGFPG